MENTMKKINFAKILGENLIYEDCLDFDMIFQPTDTSECYPIINRHAQYLAWNDLALTHDVIGIWLALINFLHDLYKAILKKRGMSNFICISFNDFDFYEGCPPIPSIYTSTVHDEDYFRVNMKSHVLVQESKEMCCIKKYFELSGLAEKFNFYESRSLDVHEGEGEEIIWIYCVGKNID